MDLSEALLTGQKEKIGFVKPKMADQGTQTDDTEVKCLQEFLLSQQECFDLMTQNQNESIVEQLQKFIAQLKTLKQKIDEENVIK